MGGGCNGQKRREMEWHSDNCILVTIIAFLFSCVSDTQKPACTLVVNRENGFTL